MRHIAIKRPLGHVIKPQRTAELQSSNSNEIVLMARAVQEVPNVLIMAEPMAAGDTEDILRIQNGYLAFNITKSMLRAANLNGLQREPESRFTHEVINEPGFKDAVATIEKACLMLRDSKEDEMGSLVSTMDITDSQLCANFKKVSDHLMAEEIRFGRIVSLFFFTYVLAKRLHLEGRQREVKSTVEWLRDFLDEKISPWLMRHHGGKWVSSSCKLLITSQCTNTGFSLGWQRQEAAAKVCWPLLSWDCPVTVLAWALAWVLAFGTWWGCVCCGSAQILGILAGFETDLETDLNGSLSSPFQTVRNADSTFPPESLEVPRLARR